MRRGGGGGGRPDPETVKIKIDNYLLLTRSGRFFRQLITTREPRICDDRYLRQVLHAFVRQPAKSMQSITGASNPSPPSPPPPTGTGGLQGYFCLLVIHFTKCHLRYFNL